MADAQPLDDDAVSDLADLRGRLDAVLATTPLPLARASALAAAYRAYVDAQRRPVTATRAGRARP